MTTVSPSATLVDQIESLAPATPWQPAHEIVVTGREVRLSVDLPGVLPKNVHVALTEGRLELWGHRLKGHEPKALSLRSNRPCGDFVLDVLLPDWTDERRAYQTFEAGVLTVVFPRRRASQPSAHARV